MAELLQYLFAVAVTLGVLRLIPEVLDLPFRLYRWSKRRG